MAYIYILINHSIVNPDTKEELVKIGWTDKTPEERAKQLTNQTSAAAPFEVYAAYKTDATIRTDIEVHNLINEITANKYHFNKEYFSIKPDKAYKILEHIAKISNTEVNLIPPKNLIVTDGTKQPIIHGSYTLSDLGIKNGDELVYKRDTTKKCKVIYDDVPNGVQLEFEDEEYTFKGLVEKLTGAEFHQNAKDEFLFGDKTIYRIYKEKVKK